MSFLMEGLKISDDYINVKYHGADPASLHRRAKDWLSRVPEYETEIRERYSNDRMLPRQLDNLDAVEWGVDAVRQNTAKMLNKASIKEAA